jgi:hypothetical protein
MRIMHAAVNRHQLFNLEHAPLVVPGNAAQVHKHVIRLFFETRRVLNILLNVKNTVHYFHVNYFLHCVTDILLLFKGQQAREEQHESHIQ